MKRYLYSVLNVLSAVTLSRTTNVIMIQYAHMTLQTPHFCCVPSFLHMFTCLHKVQLFTLSHLPPNMPIKLGTAKQPINTYKVHIKNTKTYYQTPINNPLTPTPEQPIKSAGVVSATSVKFLGKLSVKKGDKDSRDEWWRELRYVI